ncbi:MAG: Re/Si-specific NAD(P)(+) transhydrogenase subunit alpha [Bacteroidales bacterium]|nr:Re/Si-specific NAD(P)(+) transhydrogenase subunit alpha [Bacteroidales bacterium]
MKVGLLKETGDDLRVALLTDNVRELVKMNLTLLVQSGAGEGAFVSDNDYSDAGAAIKNFDEVISQADMLLRINPFSEQEMSGIDEGKVLVSLFNPLMNKALLEYAASRNVTTFSLDSIPRITRAQSMDVLSSMATIAGYKAVVDAAMNLPKFFPMFMTAAGTIKPAKVLVLGAGVAGLQAIATGRRLGGVLEAFDVRSEVKEEVQSLGAKFIEVEGAQEAADAGGYAVEQTEDYKQKQRQLVHDHAIKSDVIITTAQIPGKKAPLLVHKETVEQMKPGSVIVDLAASSGGNCELTENDTMVVKHQVKIIGKSDYPNDMPVDASKMFGNNLTDFLKVMFSNEGEFNLNFEDNILKETCFTHEGEIVNERLKTVKK